MTENNDQARAVVLAAGTGSRLRPLTDTRPKCMVDLFGITLLHRQVMALRIAGITDITIVTGYMSDQVNSSNCKTIFNPDFATTNMVNSLFCASEIMRGDKDLIVTYADIVVEPQLVKKVIDCKDPLCLAVDIQWRKYWQARMENPLEDAETLKLDKDSMITEVGKKPNGYDDIQGQYIGFVKFSADSVEKLQLIYSKMDRQRLYDGKPFQQMYMTSFVQYLIDIGWYVKGVQVENGWLEIDTLEDIEAYQRLEKQGLIAEFYNPNCISIGSI